MISVGTSACFVCETTAIVVLTEEEYSRISSGMAVQDALPDRDAAFRELLVSGVHEHCWETLDLGED